MDWEQILTEAGCKPNEVSLDEHCCLMAWFPAKAAAERALEVLASRGMRNLDGPCRAAYESMGWWVSGDT